MKASVTHRPAGKKSRDRIFDGDDVIPIAVVVLSAILIGAELIGVLCAGASGVMNILVTSSTVVLSAWSMTYGNKTVTRMMSSSVLLMSIFACFTVSMMTP